MTMEMQQLDSWAEWSDFYKEKLLSWEMKLDESPEEGLKSVLATQKKEANELFGRFISVEYEHWFTRDEDRPMLSHELVNRLVAPQMRNGNKIFFVVMDNLRLDQWLAIKPALAPYFQTEKEGIYNSILPSATQYARNALFAGKMPLQIKNQSPQYWLEEQAEGSKNQFEGELLRDQLSQLGLSSKKMEYHKVVNLRGANKLLDNIHQQKHNDLVALVYNFVDTLSHAKTDTEVIRNWPVMMPRTGGSPDLVRRFTAAENITMGRETRLYGDHHYRPCGTINVQRPAKVVGTKELTTNLRYKNGNGMSYPSKHGFVIKNPESVGLPKQHIADEYIFALTDYFYVYPNRFNHFAQYYRNNISARWGIFGELIIPYAIHVPK